MNCLICSQKIVPAYGEGDMLLVGEYPGTDEMAQGRPFVGQAGRILEAELMRLGINMNRQCRLTNLWQHYKTKSPECFQHFVKDLTPEMAGRKVLLMGSDLSAYFLGEKISDWSGLEVKSSLFPRSTQFVMMSQNPASCLHSPVGEFRLALEKYVRRCKGE